jgi:hypothetical protein
VPRRYKITIKCMGLFMFISLAPVNAQLLRDTSALNLVREDISHIYNLQFDEAREVYTKISNLYPAHPIVFLLRGIITYWENYPLLNTNPSHVIFEEDMRKCIEKSEGNCDTDYEAEYLLADLCARGMLLMFYNDNDLTMEVIPLTISTYKYLRRSFDYTSLCPDLNYFTGLYDYYREAYPKEYPVYKSLAILFPPGNMETGLKELRNAAANSVVMSAESTIMLQWIYLNFENNYSGALYYGKRLCEQYPQNGLYRAIYIKNLLLMKRYDEADSLLSAMPENNGNDFSNAQILILKGILQEKKYYNYKLAEAYYNKGIREISLFGTYGNEYAAYAYFGLARLSEADGQRRPSRTYRKEANKLAVFKKINFNK